MKNRIVTAGIFFAAIMFVFSCVNQGGTSRDVAAVYFNLGNSYLKQKDYKKAEEAYKQAIQIDGDYSAALFNLSRVYLNQNKFDEAESILNKLLEKDSDNSDVLEVFGFLRYLQDRKEDALIFFQQVLILDSTRQNSLFNTGLILFELERYEESLERLLLYNEYYPDDSAGLLFLARIGMNFEDSEDYLKYYSAYLDSKSSDSKVRSEYLDILFEKQIYEEAHLQAVELAKSLEERELAAVLYIDAFSLLVGFEDYKAGMEALETALDAGFSDRNKLAAIVYAEDFLYSEEVAEFLEEKELLISEEDYQSYLKSLEPEPEEAAEDETDASAEGDAETVDSPVEGTSEGSEDEKSDASTDSSGN